ncbi:hypothetical protein CH352_13250 [Leptospira hartskeerlii]|uniref:Uncharacterized protein n=1 Tax=Leptospira hartskeerlii TaxID=2023177 RepID=A0A2M9XAA7_9LEPT|nr:hypothetical protein [Leptospira hartskeerlii]PJZ24631.1 hypothetical protein CH357_13635 [Leptospira hartskeerlii]PJZ33279.1 hypothetical protein CH352_13250 [Leptospira hartskeerlii]
MNKEEIENRAFVIIAQAQYLHTDSKLYSDFGLVLLDAGIQTLNTQILAGLQSGELDEARNYFFRALDELSIPKLPDENTLRYHYARAVAQRVLNDELSPFMGVDIMQRMAYDSFNDPICSDFIWIDEAIELQGSSYTPIPEFEVNPKAYILEAFRHFLCILDTVPERHLQDVVICENCNHIEKMDQFWDRKFDWKSFAFEVILRCPKCKSKQIIDCQDNEGKRKYFAIRMQNYA